MNYFHLLAIFFIISTNGISQENYGKSESFLLEGNINGRDSGMIVLWYPTISDVWVKDTAYLQSGDFKFAGLLNQPTFCHLIGSAKDGNYTSIFLEAGKQYILLEEDHFSDSRMTGSVSQREDDSLNLQCKVIEAKYKKLYVQYDSLQLGAKKQFDILIKQTIKSRLSIVQEENNSKLEREKRQLKILFIKKHPYSFVSTTHLYGLLITKQIQTSEAELLYNELNPLIQFGRAGKILRAELDKRKINIPAPDFTALDRKNKSITLRQFKGKYILVNFWASWCVPCIREIPFLKRMYTLYHDRGFEIVTISIDKNLKNLVNAIKQHSIDNWHNVISNSSISDNYSNPALPIPSLLLVNREGLIIWNSLNQSDREISLEKILKKEFLQF